LYIAQSVALDKIIVFMCFFHNIQL